MAEEGPTDKEAEAHSSSRDPTSARTSPLIPEQTLLGRSTFLVRMKPPQSQMQPWACSVAQSCPTLCAAPWTVAHQAPLSIGFSRKEYWSGLPGPPPGDLPNPGIKSMSLMSPACAEQFFTTSTTWDTLGLGPGVAN